MASNHQQQLTWTLLGIPDDRGVANTGGRIGASRGPSAFRQVWEKLSGRDGVTEACRSLGDVTGLGHDVDENHRLTIPRVQEAHAHGAFSVLIGGGHDHGLPHLQGVKAALFEGATLGCINVDAHLDLRPDRPVMMSGSPFYAALEREVIQSENLIEFGTQRHCNGASLWDYVEKKKIRVFPFEEIRQTGVTSAFEGALLGLADRVDVVVLSFCLDALPASDAPGVSAPQADGLTSRECMQMMEIAGAHSKVDSLGIFELNPEHDRDDQTARLAAQMVYHFAAAKLSRPLQ